MRRTISFTLSALSLVLSGCDALPGGIPCTTLYAYGISATVTDATNGSRMNNATLTLVDGNYQEMMQSFPTGDYVGAGERAGTYSLTAGAPGFQTQTIDDIVVTADACHVHGVHIDVQLVPTP